MPIMMFGLGGPGGIGSMLSQDDDTPIRKITDEEARDELLKYLTNNNGIIENIEKDEFTQKFYDDKLKQSILDPSKWNNYNYNRPTKIRADEIKENLIKNGVKLPSTSRVGSGTDMQIWTYTNTEWEKYDRGLRVDVIIEFGNIIGITVDVNLEEEFFF